MRALQPLLRSVFGLVLLLTAVAAGSASARPNVLLIVTDDQGWGDLGVHGNDKIRTPHIDRFARDGVRLKRFYGGPVCTPMRAELMTGRYHFRTGAIDTYRGRAIMHPGEVTLAEQLAAAGYRTAIFGKWHLGDHYPSRAIDQGFREALVHYGGGLVQPSDPPQGNSYFDPWLEHNGTLIKTSGYCSDIFADAAIRYIDASTKAGEPFFVYLPFNAPHTPLQVADELARPYLEAGLDGRIAKIYAMVSNIDANVGRVLAALDERNIARDTLVLFMSDNGPEQARYNGVLRGLKKSTYEGGVRVPCFVRWPASFKGGREVDRIGGAIDVLPTVLAVCGVTPAPGVKLDGVNLLPLLRGDDNTWPDRTLYAQWHRGDAPDAGRNCAAISQRYKLVQPLGIEAGPPPVNPKWELYDLHSDPGEQHDLAAAKPDVVAAMRKGYDAWFADVTATRGFQPVPIHVGTDHENPVLLTRQDRREGKDPAIGHWAIHISREGTYTVTLLFDPSQDAGTGTFSIGNVKREAAIAANARELTFADVPLAAGDARLEAVILRGGSAAAGVNYVRIDRR